MEKLWFMKLWDVLVFKLEFGWFSVICFVVVYILNLGIVEGESICYVGLFI